MSETSTDLIVKLPSIMTVEYFTNESEIDKLIASVKAVAKAHVPDLSTATSRAKTKSVAFKVSQTKTEIIRQGKKLSEEARNLQKKVNTACNIIEEELDGIRDEVKKPVTDWEDQEAARLDALKLRFSALDAGRADAHCPSEQIKSVLAEIEATDIGEDWEEYQDEARLARDRAVKTLQQNLVISAQRETDALELEELRALKAAKEEEDRQRRETEEAAAKLRERAIKARQYIGEVEKGFIGGEPQPYGILIYELDRKLPPLIDELGAYAEELHILRETALRSVTLSMQQQAAADAARAEEDRKASAEQAEAAAKEAAVKQKADDEARHKVELEAAAQAERDKIESDRKAEESARAKREADATHRAKIATDIAGALRTMSGRATPEAIAEALIEGKIPHTTVRM